jgi:hypothetical protein
MLAERYEQEPQPTQDLPSAEVEAPLTLVPPIIIYNRWTLLRMQLQSALHTIAVLKRAGAASKDITNADQVVQEIKHTAHFRINDSMLDKRLLTEQKQWEKNLSQS